MANFAKEQLMKYGWTEGKGLGKNENGITEPVRLATSRDKTGVGYDETEAWWERLFDDATRNVRVESRGDEVSLSVVDAKGLGSVTLSHRHGGQRFVGPESTRIQLALDQKPNAVSDKAARRDLTSGGKLGRIAEQDRTLLNGPQLCAVSSEGMAYRRASAESDVEEKEHGMDNNDSVLQFEEKDGFVRFTRSTKKKHRKRINKLVEKLGTCNLGNTEENRSIESSGVADDNDPASNASTKVFDASHADFNCGEYCGNAGRRRSNLERRSNYIKHYLNNKKLSQKMKRGKEKSMDSSAMLSCLKNSTVNEIDLKPFSLTIYEDVNASVHDSPIDCRKVKTLFNAKKNFISQYKNVLPIKLEDEEDSWYKIVVSPDLSRRKADRQSKERAIVERTWLTCDVEDKIWQRNDHYNLMLPICDSKQDVSTKNTKSPSIYCRDMKRDMKRDILSHIDQDLREHYIRRLNDKIQKKKEQRFRSKLKRITEKLRGEALANELNSVIKNFTAFDLTEKVNANAITKKSTQSHLTPV